MSKLLVQRFSIFQLTHLKLYRLPPGNGGRANIFRVDGGADLIHEFSYESRVLLQTSKESEYRFESYSLYRSLIGKDINKATTCVSSNLQSPSQHRANKNFRLGKHHVCRFQYRFYVAQASIDYTTIH